MNYSDQLNQWIDHALFVADTKGIDDNEIIRTELAEGYENFLFLTVGCVRELRAWQERVKAATPQPVTEVSVPIGILSDLRFAVDDLEKGFTICEACGHQTNFEDSPLDCADWVRGAWEYLDSKRPTPPQERT